MVSTSFFFAPGGCSTDRKSFPAEDYYCPPKDVIQLELAGELRGHFNLIHHETGFKADIYLSGRDELHTWGLAHARQAAMGDDRVTLAPPEYVIIRKLQFFREGQSQKHLRDVSRMLHGLGDAWSRADLETMLKRGRLESEWDHALEFEG